MKDSCEEEFKNRPGSRVEHSLNVMLILEVGGFGLKPWTWPVHLGTAQFYIIFSLNFLNNSLFI